LTKLELNGNAFSEAGIKSITKALKEINRDDALGNMSDNEASESGESEGSQDSDEELTQGLAAVKI